MDGIKKRLEKKNDDLAILEGKAPAQFWLDDLDEFLEKLTEYEASEQAEEEKEADKYRNLSDHLPSPKGKKIEADVSTKMVERAIEKEKAQENAAAKMKSNANAIVDIASGKWIQNWSLGRH